MTSGWESQRMRATIIVLLTIVVYLPVLRGGFLWDDDYLITNNRIIKESNGLHRYWFTTEADDYWPLTSTAWWVEWRLWGTNPMGYHIVNLLLHAANAVLVWLILQRLKILRGWVAALVFAIHPVNVATAAWISEQKNTQSMLFFALAILLYLRFDEARQWKWYGFSLAAFLLALLSKAAVVMLPVVLLGCVWWSRGQLRAKDFLRAVPFFILAGGLGLVTVWFQHQHRLALELAVAPVSLASRLATAGSVPWFYLRQAVLPVHLALVYPHWQVYDTRWTSYALGALLMGGLILFWWKRNVWGRPLLFGLGYFLTMLLPVLGFFDQSYHRISSVADHWQYYAIIGPIALVVAVLGKLSRYRQVVLVVAGLFALGVTSWTRVSVYANAATFWREYVAEDPDSYIAHVNLGVVLARAGKSEEAVRQFEQTIRLKPDYAQAYYNLGGAFAQLGRNEEAIKQFEQAVRLKPNDAEAHNNLANALAQDDRLVEAVWQYEEALRLRPDSVEIRTNLRLAQRQLARRQAPGSLNEK
jgi:tetratricopeptide (TPR) repeat protein